MAKAHLCLGGPLDGEHAQGADFYGGYEKIPGTRRNDYSKRVEGMYEHLRSQYVQFNTASHGYAKSDVVWIHRDLLTGSVSPKDR